MALEFKLLPLEQLGSQKEMYFKDSLNKRLQIMIEYLNLNIKPRELQKIFTRNLPRNLKEISEIMKNLKGLISDETLISLFPSVEDARIEIEKIKTEAEENNIYNDYGILNKNKVDDKKIRFNPIFNFQVEETKLIDGKTVIVGNHKKVGGISEKLAKRLMNNGMPTNELNKLRKG